MDPIVPAKENSPVVRYSFLAIFIPACFYQLELGVRIAGVFLLGLALYEAVLGRVPLIGRFSWTTRGYLRGPAATALILTIVLISAVFIFAPNLVIGLVGIIRTA